MCYIGCDEVGTSDFPNISAKFKLQDKKFDGVKRSLSFFYQSRQKI